ncbi:velvet factor-domain-containing protein [Mortierella sp. GBAus27b]|nr:hypothetical protein BGX31_004398 [Mortierella sp. GBA43]KAI8361851.1 velvet factor-domain-containing protein [Mortierella sp. GBAus27b]
MVKPSSSVPYCFVSGQTEKSKAASSSKYVLILRQQPQRAKVCGMKERDRRPIDPPPIVQIKLAEPSTDKNKDYLQSPYLFMCCNLVNADDPSGKIVAPAHRALAGTVVSSLNRLKDVDNTDGGFFVFGDMSVRSEGHFRLRLTLFELIEGEAVHVMTTFSNAFTAYPSRTFPGMSEPTFLSRSFSDQGVRIRIRKDHHVKPKQTPSNDADGSAMHSPPSSCHEADHSDNDMEAHQPAKRSRASVSSEDTARHYSMAPRTKHTEATYSPSESMHRTPPSSPKTHLGQDPVPSRPRHDPYLFDDAPARGPSGQYPYHGSNRPSHYDNQPYYRHEYGPNGSYPHSSSYHHPANQRPYHPSYTPPSHEHGPSSYGPAPSHPLDAAHPSSVHSPAWSSPDHHSSVPGHTQPMHAGRHGFPAELLNHDETKYSQGPYHSRTPSMSSQHSEENSPPHPPFSPPEPQLHFASHDRVGSPMSSGTTLPSILSSLSKASISGEKIQLPPIHMLSTNSPPVRPATDHYFTSRP